MTGSEHRLQASGAPVDQFRPKHLPWIEHIPRRDRAPLFPEVGQCYANTSTNDVYQWDGVWQRIAEIDSPFWYGDHTPDWQPFR